MSVKNFMKQEGDVKDFYELTDLKRYTEEMGLDLSVELGKALFV